jgi:putative membrane protein
MLLAVTNATPDVWRFQAHPEVWLLVAFLVGAYVYTARVIGPRVVPAGERPVSGRQIVWFTLGITMLWTASDWPLHDIGEKYLYSAHMLQHMVLSYFMPPLLLLATPEWMARLLLGRGRAYAAIRWLTKPVVAGVIFNSLVMITHIPGVVNNSVENGALHYSLHAGLVLTSLLMWTPVCGPLPEARLKPGATMIYLFVQSVIPTVPAGWLTFADGAVYKVYDKPFRMWGLSVTYDQQLAGVIMKIGGSVFIWTITTIIFFKRFMANWEQENKMRPPRYVPPAAPVDATLTYEEVTEAFDRTPAAPEPATDGH